MNAKARLEEIRDKLLERTRAKLEIDYSGRGVLTVNDVMQILLEAGVTLPPQPAGPMKPAEAVTSEEAAEKYLLAFDAAVVACVEFSVARRQALDATMSLLARDHGYVKLSEVERRARGWSYTRGTESFCLVGLLSAMTAPAATGEASTASSPPVCASCGERKEKCNGC